jgi:hypothetical protein
MKMKRAPASLLMTLSLLVLSATPANAQTPPSPLKKEEPTWNPNVPKQRQDAAEELLRAGNALAKKSAFDQAEAKYREALTYWNHPSIHYNLALALAPLDRPVEVHEQLMEALRYGESPLGTAKYALARDRLEALEKQLARVEVACESPDAVVSVGGQSLPLVNGHYEGWMRPGVVTFTATQKDHQPREKQIALAPGTENTIHFKLYTHEELLGYERRWAPWKPWAAVGAGAALAAGGGVLYWQARHGYHSYDDHVLECARGAADRGCRESELASRISQVETLHKLSVGALALGTAALATGTALVFLNRPGSHPVDLDDVEGRQGVAVTPILGGANGVLVTFQY